MNVALWPSSKHATFSTFGYHATYICIISVKTICFDEVRKITTGSLRSSFGSCIFVLNDAETAFTLNQKTWNTYSCGSLNWKVEKSSAFNLSDMLDSVHRQRNCRSTQHTIQQIITTFLQKRELPILNTQRKPKIWLLSWFIFDIWDSFSFFLLFFRLPTNAVFIVENTRHEKEERWEHRTLIKALTLEKSVFNKYFQLFYVYSLDQPRKVDGRYFSVCGD